MINFETVLPSVGGWLRASEIKAGDFLYNQHGQPTEVLSATQHDDIPQVKISHKGTWDVDYFISTDQNLITSHNLKFPRVESINEWHPFYRVTKCLALDPPPLDVPMDPFAFGLWFWDYNSVYRIKAAGDSREPPVKVSAFPTAVRALNHAGFEVIKKRKHRVKRNRAENFRLTLSPTTIWAKLAQHYYKKPTTIPDEYMYGSLHQRTQLVDSFFAAYRPTSGQDKKIHEHMYVSFYKNQELTAQLNELCRSIGYSVSTHTYRGDLAFLVKNKTTPRSSRVKTIEPIPNEPAIDIQTRAGHFLITESNIIIPCQN